MIEQGKQKRNIVKHAPNNLVIYMSGFCNLKCAYCYSRKMPFKEVIKKKVLLSSISEFLKSSSPDKKITFLGGEPFLHFNLLKDAVFFIRKKMKSDLPVHVFTNGRLIDEGISRFIDRYNVKLCVSLNAGSKNKIFSFDGISKILSNIDLNAVIASVVITTESVRYLSANIKRIYDVGFRHIAWSPDMTQVWGKFHIISLEKEMLKLRGQYLKLIKNGDQVYEIANAYEIIGEIFNRPLIDKCLSAVLCPDGYFIPCDKIIGADKKDIKKFSSKKISGGKKKNLFFKEALSYGADVNCIMCPVASFAFAKYVAKKDDGEIEKAVKSHMKLSGVIKRNLSLLVKTALKYPIFRMVHGIDGKGL